LIGAGGMGEVYAAVDTRLDRSEAIKLLPEHVASNPDRRERFHREARAVSSLNHQCIAKTQYSFSTDPKLRGAPEGHVFNVRDIYLSAGAGFMVVLSADMMTMPGLPRVPAFGRHRRRRHSSGSRKDCFL
jgi:formyltetrahydrofolate synthetase